MVVIIKMIMMGMMMNVKMVITMPMVMIIKVTIIIMMMMAVMVVMMTIKVTIITTMKMMKMMMSPAVCSSSISPASPFLCLDIIYLCVMLEDLGFPPDKTFKVSRLLQAVLQAPPPWYDPTLSVF